MSLVRQTKTDDSATTNKSSGGKSGKIERMISVASNIAGSSTTRSNETSDRAARGGVKKMNSGKRRAGRANRFLSWAWRYKKNMVLQALRIHVHRTGLNPEEIYLWWCWFCNNQFRILLEKESRSPEELQQVFGDTLKSVGRMWMCLDRIKDSFYTSRIWCVFELYIATTTDVPCDVIMDTESKEAGHLGEIHESVDDSISGLVQACSVDVAKAQASHEDDEIAIKRLIQEKSSFNTVNRTVERQLWTMVISQAARAEDCAEQEHDAIEGEQEIKEETIPDESNQIAPDAASRILGSFRRSGTRVFTSVFGSGAQPSQGDDHGSEPEMTMISPTRVSL